MAQANPQESLDETEFVGISLFGNPQQLGLHLSETAGQMPAIRRFGVCPTAGFLGHDFSFACELRLGPRA